jgi:hypothetical protein
MGFSKKYLNKTDDYETIIKFGKNEIKFLMLIKINFNKYQQKLLFFEEFLYLLIIYRDV